MHRRNFSGIERSIHDGLLVGLHALGQQVGRGLVVGCLGDREHLACHQVQRVEQRTGDVPVIVV
jgi:hypothetical protein